MAEGRGSSKRDALRPPKDDPDLEPQMRHYDVSPDPIGAGGFGTVREGLHLGSNTVVAIKKLFVGKNYFGDSKEAKAAQKEEKTGEAPG